MRLMREMLPENLQACDLQKGKGVTRLNNNEILLCHGD